VGYAQIFGGVCGGVCGKCGVFEKNLAECALLYASTTYLKGTQMTNNTTHEDILELLGLSSNATPHNPIQPAVARQQVQVVQDTTEDILELLGLSNQPTGVVEPEPAAEPSEPAGTKRKRAVKKEIAPPTPTLEHSELFATSGDVPATLDELSMCEAVSLDLETTSLTPFCSAETAGKSVKVGDKTITAYRKQYACEVDATPRPRIITARALPLGEPRAFDIDYLSIDNKDSLTKSLDGKVWVGHNLAFDLMWLRSIGESITPAYIIDTMLLCMTHAPALTLAVEAFVMVGDTTLAEKYGWQDAFESMSDNTISALKSKIRQKRAGKKFGAGDDRTERGVSLDYLSLVFLNEKLDKTYQKPHNWQLTKLSNAHHAYCLGDTTQPPQIAKLLLGLPVSAPISELIQAIKAHPSATAYDTFVHGAIALTKMQRNGLHMSRDAAESFCFGQREAAEIACETFINELPAMVVHKESLLDASRGMTDIMKNDFAAALLEKTGIAVDLTVAGSPSLGAKSLQLKFGDNAALTAYQDLASALKQAAMAEAYLSDSDKNGRVHSMVSINTVTGRTASQAPNLQNAPRGKAFRALFTARPGHKIAAIDYAAIELRIAAALSVRAYRVFKKFIVACTAEGQTMPLHELIQAHFGVRGKSLLWVLGDGSVVSWITRLIETGTRYEYVAIYDQPTRDSNLGATGWLNWYKWQIYSFIEKMYFKGAFGNALGGKSDGDRLTMQHAFKSGIDPHLVTAVATEVVGGRMNIGGVLALDYLADGGKALQKELKATMKDPRQAAKTQNFGLLYGMSIRVLHSYGITNYGLNWTEDEALLAGAGWFDTYPEIGLWQVLNRLAKVKVLKDSEADDEDEDMILHKQETKNIFIGSTLTCRITASDRITSALNYQDQGTGAEIALAALASFPPEILNCLVNFVHDEFVFEAPDADIESVTKEASRLMIAAADGVLAQFDVPTEVEAEIGDCWIH